MKIEIITTGNEIICGLTADTNFQWATAFLSSNGFSVNYHTSVKDVPDDILISLSNAKNRADVVIVSGGLGPTEDDLTAKVAADFFGVEMELNKEALKLIKNIFKKRNRKLHDINKKPAYLPKKSIIIVNDIGTAPGFYFNFKNTKFFFLPGVPREFKSMLKDRVLPKLSKSVDKFITKSSLIKTYGLKESEVALKLKNLKLNNGVNLGYRSHFPEIHLRLTFTGSQEAEIEKILAEDLKKIHQLLNEYIFAYDDALIEEEMGRSLNKFKLNLSVAESCTGGLVSSRITNIPGSSKYFNMGLVCYSNESKIKELSIPGSVLNKYGAVSSQVAELMSYGIVKKSGSDLGVGITGIAGPGGGTKDKPVGTVYISLAFREKIVFSEKYAFNGDRKQIKLITSTQAFDLIRKFLLNYVYSS